MITIEEEKEMTLDDFRIGETFEHKNSYYIVTKVNSRKIAINLITGQYEEIIDRQNGLQPINFILKQAT